MKELEMLEERKKKLEKINRNRLIAETKKEELGKRWKEKKAQLKALGIEDPKDDATIEAFIKEKEDEIAVKLKELDGLMSEETLSKFAAMNINELEDEEELSELEELSY